MVPQAPRRAQDSARCPGTAQPRVPHTQMGPAVGVLPRCPASPGSPNGNHPASQHSGEAGTTGSGVQSAGVGISAPAFAARGGHGGLQAA